MHIEHHLSPGAHWTRYPERAVSHRERYESLNAIGFDDGPGQLETYYRCLWRNDFVGLSGHVYIFGGEQLETEDLVRLLEHRTAAVGQDWLAVSAFETRIGILASHLI